MSEYIVTARKWRPMKFEDVTGQNHVTTTLQNAIATNRIAHAYLFSGPRGVGKTTTARLLAKAVNCVDPNGADECDICREITEGRSFDVLEIDGASNRGVDEIRNLREAVRYAPAKAKYKVYIIDEVHMLTKEAFNALLKTLEEPPASVLFIFATTEIQKVPATILSRCQRFDFHRISIEEIKNNLAGIAKNEGITIEGDALQLIARKGDGSLRDAQSFFDQVVSLCGTTITLDKILVALNVVDHEMYFRVTEAIKAKDPKAAVALVEQVTTRGYDLKEFLSGLTEHLRNILVAKTTSSTDLLEVSDVFKKRYASEATAFQTADLVRMMRFIAGTEGALRWSSHPRFRLEADMVQLVTMPGALELQALIQSVDDLKKKLAEKEVNYPVSRQVPVVGENGNTGTRKVLPSRRVPLYNRPANSRAPTSPSSRTNSSSQPTVVSQDEITARWDELIAEVRIRQRVSLASVLDTSTLLAVTGGVVKIGCSNEFQGSSIQRNKEFLADVFHKVFNSRARFDVEVSRTHVAPPKNAKTGSSQPNQITPASPSTITDEHPVIQALMRELGAEPIE